MEHFKNLPNWLKRPGTAPFSDYLATLLAIIRLRFLHVVMRVEEIRAATPWNACISTSGERKRNLRAVFEAEDFGSEFTTELLSTLFAVPLEWVKQGGL